MNKLTSALRDNIPAVILIGAVTVVLGFRLLDFVNLYGSELVYKDRWQTMEPLFFDYSWWEGFAFQHGPHRLGLIFFLFKLDAYFGDWNCRVDLFAQASIYILTSFLALGLKIKLTKKLSYSDVIIPLILLSPHAAHTMFSNPFVHGLVPLFAVGLCYIYLIKHDFRRILALSIFSFLAAFTGFAFILIPVILLIWLFQAAGSNRYRKLIHVIPSLIGMAGVLFILITNVPKPSTEIVSFSASKGLEYAIGLIGSFFILQPDTTSLIIAGIALTLLIALAIYVFSKARFQIEDSMSKTILILLGGAVVFWVVNIYGRGHLSIGNVMASRYIPIGMLFALSIYFLFLKLDSDVLRSIVCIAYVLVLSRMQYKTDHRMNDIAVRSAQLKATTECLLEGNTIDECEEGVSAQYSLHPDPSRVGLQEKIDFLRENQLSIFRDRE